MGKNKALGQYFTPEWIVDMMLDKVLSNDLKSTDYCVLEPSFGEGIFIIKFIDKFLKICNSWTKEDQRKFIENNIFGSQLPVVKTTGL